MANLHLVPDGVSTENAAFAEPLAAAFRIVEQQLVGPAVRRTGLEPRTSRPQAGLLLTRVRLASDRRAWRLWATVS